MAKTQSYFRIDRTLPNGWKMRLDMIGYDSDFTASVTTLDPIVITEIGALTAEFDSLPYGLMNPMTFNFNLIWDRLPADMQDYLEEASEVETNIAGYRRNTWYVYTDRGTNGATYTLEFVGCEDNIEALELAPVENGMFTYNVELVDVAYYFMKSIPASAAFGISTMVLSELAASKTIFQDSNRVCWQVMVDNDNYRDRQQEHEFFSINTYAKFAKLDDILSAIYTLPYIFQEPILHTTIGNSFDYGNNLKNIITHAVQFYPVDDVTVLPRVASSTPLDNDDVYVCAAIYANNTTMNPLGGMLAPSDGYTIAGNNDSMYDVIRDLCEQSAVRVGYRFAQVSSGATTEIRLIFDVKTITQARDAAKNSDTADATLSLSKALTYSSVTKRGDNILKAEVRYETGSDRDATEIVKIQKGARASRSMNIEPRVHNMPVHILDNNPDDNWPLFKAPIKQTNQLFFRGDLVNNEARNFIKVHEKTRIIWGWDAVGSTYEYVEVDPEGLKNPVQARNFKTDNSIQAEYFLKLNDAQVNGCITAALCDVLLTVFSDEDNAIVEVEWPITYNTKVMPDYIAGKFALTNEAAGKFPNINWSRAMPVSISVDLLAGKATHRYYMVSA